VVAGNWDEDAFFEAIARSGLRVLLIGRRALATLGIPVLTADYDLWIDIEQIAALNAVLRPLDLLPNYTPEVARTRGRYVLEGDMHVDVLVARSSTTKDQVNVRFDDVWERRQTVPFRETISVTLPSIDDLILTKRWSMRPKDIPDIQLLEALRRERGGT
jgi:hypothetical protein